MIKTTLRVTNVHAPKIQENWIFRLFCGENEVKKRFYCNFRFLTMDGRLSPQDHTIKPKTEKEKPMDR